MSTDGQFLLNLIQKYVPKLWFPSHNLTILQEFSEYLKKLETILESKNKCVESLRAQVACYSLRAAY